MKTGAFKFSGVHYRKPLAYRGREHEHARPFFPVLKEAGAYVRSRRWKETCLFLVVLLLAFSVSLLACAHGDRREEQEPLADEVEEEYVSTPPIPRAPAPEPIRKPQEEPGTMLEPIEDDDALDVPEPPKVEVEVSPAARSAFEAGVRAAGEGDWEVSMQRFEEAVRLDSDLAWGWYNLGVARERSGDPAGAMGAWREALDLDSSFAPAAVNIARTMVRQGRAREAERMLRERIEEHPEILDLRNELGRVLIAQGTPAKLEGAFREARQVLASDERNVGALLVLGQVFVEKGQLELAEWVIERVLALDPNNSVAHQMLGFLQLDRGERREAFGSFRQAALSAGEYAEMYVNYGALLNQAQDFDAAIENLEKAVSYSPRMVEARLNLGNAYRGAGRYQEALAEYEQVRNLDPSNADAVLNMALIYLDASLPRMETLERLRRAEELLASYARMGGGDERFSDFVRDVERAIDVEERRVEREALREAEEVERARAEAREEAERRAQEEEARRAAREEERRAEAERARREAEEAFRARRASEAEGSRLGEDDEEEEEEEDDNGEGDGEVEAGTRLEDEPASREAGTRLGGDE